MSDTYVEMNTNEVRAIRVSIRDQDDSKFLPSSVTYTVVDSNDETVKSGSATIDDNIMIALIDTDVTGTAGDYDVIWKITKDSYTYYHKTNLIVNDL